MLVALVGRAKGVLRVVLKILYQAVQMMLSLGMFQIRGERRHTTCTSTNSIRNRQQLPARFFYDDYLLLARQRQITTPDSLNDYPSTPVALFNGKRIIYVVCLVRNTKMTINVHHHKRNSCHTPFQKLFKELTDYSIFGSQHNNKE